MRKILDRERGLGMDALVVYGLTEATGRDTLDRVRAIPSRKRVSTVGRADPGDRGPHRGPRHRRQPLAAGAGGRGLRLWDRRSCCGYYKQAGGATADKIRDGWLHTGDMGVKDADGYLRITGPRSPT